MKTKMSIAIVVCSLATVISIFLGLLLSPAFLLIALVGVVAVVVLGFRQAQIKDKTKTVKANMVVGGILVFLAVSFVFVVVAASDMFSEMFQPSHKSVALAEPIPTTPVDPPFKTPQDFVTGYNQRMQMIFEKRAVGSFKFDVNAYFLSSSKQQDIAFDLPDMQRDVNLLHKLVIVILSKRGDAAASQFMKDLFPKSDSHASIRTNWPYIRPQTLKEKSPHTYVAIDTAGNDVVIQYANATGWRQDLDQGRDALGVDIESIMLKMLPPVLISVIKRVENGELKKPDSMVRAINEDLDWMANPESQYPDKALHDAVPLAKPIPTKQAESPFKTPQEFVAGYNQRMQMIYAKNEPASLEFDVNDYFMSSSKDPDIKFDCQALQHEFNLMYQLVTVISDKMGHTAAKQFMKKMFEKGQPFSDIVFSPWPYIRPETLKKESQDNYSAIDTAGNNVVIQYAKATGWREDLDRNTDYFGLAMKSFCTVEVTSKLTSVLKRVKSAQPKSVEDIVDSIRD